MVTRLGQGSLLVRAASSRSPMTLEAPTGAVVLGEALGAVGLARAEALGAVTFGGTRVSARFLQNLSFGGFFL
jgi:hypothetical protein